MIIRATHKTLNVAGLKVPIESPIENTEMPGEWTAGLVSLGKPGKMAVNYVHNITRISVLINGKSINKTNSQLIDKVSDYLTRFGHSDLIPLFKLRTPIEIYGSANKSVLGHMNELRRNFEYQFDRFTTAETIDFNNIEDLYFDYLFRIKSKGNNFHSTKKILADLSLNTNA
jgi:hypothetical protein